VIESRHLLPAAIAAALLLGSPTFAAAQQEPQQEPAAEQPPVAAVPGTYVGLQELDEDALLIERFGLTVGQIEDMPIVTAGDERVGEVDELLLNAEGRIVAVSAEVGGFLGIGDREVVLGLDQLEHEANVFRIDMTREQIEALPTWEE
jgi:hypothetical protein